MPLTIDTNNKYLRFFLWLVLISYMLLLTKFVLFKKPPDYIKAHLLHHYGFRSNLHTANLKPFHTIRMYLAADMPVKKAFINLVGNVAGFVPLSILLALLFNSFRYAGRTIFCVFLLSLGFEIFQLISSLGECDIDDIILNTLGGIIGYFLFWVMTKSFLIK